MDNVGILKDFIGHPHLDWYAKFPFIFTDSNVEQIKLEAIEMGMTPISVVDKRMLAGSPFLPIYMGMEFQANKQGKQVVGMLLTACVGYDQNHMTDEYFEPQTGPIPGDEGYY